MHSRITNVYPLPVAGDIVEYLLLISGNHFVVPVEMKWKLWRLPYHTIPRISPIRAGIFGDFSVFSNASFKIPIAVFKCIINS